ncbi:MAG: nucleotide-binding protein [Ferroplasma sp.]|uniref:nucleotide-binding protein n=1 Tax=Ferroplasma sp. TaxID=2591003 RepID=UPI002814A814|nr:nucleotide-binding protein [Ferroplasma sp.]WMT52162.1 MAG: nucleotide-binding protein [Ferroplasma sp.]
MKCSTPDCPGEMEPAGNMNFRVGGYTGIGGMFLGGWNDLAETTQTFTLYKCNTCGKVELYEPQPVQDNNGEKKHHFL